MDKFGRNYKLYIQGTDGSIITISLPFTLEFDITRTTLTSANSCNFRVYNLSQTNRDLIRKNRNDSGDLRLITLEAGYGDTTPKIFIGMITLAFSYREGVDFVTEIEAMDGGFTYLNSTGKYDPKTRKFTPLPVPTFAKNTTTEKAFSQIVSLMPDVQVGVIGPSAKNLPPYKRSQSINGNVIQNMYELTGGGFFIDLGKAYLLADNECLPATDISDINFTNGLLNTPRREETTLTFEMIFEPRIIMAQILNLFSVTEPILNGSYRVTKIDHRGTISEAVSGDAVTTIGLFAPWKGTHLVIVGITP